MSKNACVLPGTAPERILLVEDSRTFAAIITNRVSCNLGMEVTWAKSFKQAEELLTSCPDCFFLALLDLNLPDAPSGEVVDLCLSRDVASVVFTAEMDDDLRDHYWSKGIVDYVLKDNLDDVDYIIALIDRMRRNRGIKMLVVDDSSTMRKSMVSLLKKRNYQVLEAANGQDALAVVEENPDIIAVITDYNMPKMDGYALVKNLRRKHPRERMAIIGLSGEGGSIISAKFIKAGANDYITKPFLVEELHCRITMNIELLEHIIKNKELSETDFLTKLYNRRRFFEVGEKFFSAHTRSGSPLTVAMLDVDHFKSVNDTHGHDAGDLVLQSLAELLRNRFRAHDVVARFGGEEFCILLPDVDRERAYSIFETLRMDIEDLVVSTPKGDIRFTASIGVCSTAQDTLESMISAADKLLYQAKTTGRNKVVLD